MGRAMILNTRELPEPPDWDAISADFEGFHARFASVFARSESREQALKFLRALMGPVARRNGWQMAEAMGDPTPDRMQGLLNSAVWSADKARDLLVDLVVEHVGHPEAIGVLDETGFIKKGKASVGVARQYSGTAGKIENCQIGVFLGYASPLGHLLLDRRLYLPQSWCDDTAARTRARVPEAVAFQTKPQLALEMLRAAWARGVPMAWVAGDEVYGDDTDLREGIHEAGRRYVLAVASNTPVWTERPAVEQPPGKVPHRTGPERIHARLAPGAPHASTVGNVAASWPATTWRRMSVVEGEKGPIEYDWACDRVVESRKRLPADDVWLLARRSISDPADVAYYLSNADAATLLEVLAGVASTRYTIEQCFEEAKDDVGLDHYEVRTWPSWHRYITLGMMALAWLVTARAKLAAGAFAQPPEANATPPAPAPPDEAEKKAGEARRARSANDAGPLHGS